MNEAIRAAADAARATSGGQPFTWENAARAAVLAYLRKAHENTDPEETARYCLLGQMVKEVQR